MREAACTQERFLDDVKDHQLEVVKDEDLYRHLKLRRKNKSYLYWIDIITWPGYLCISSDCGTYVFSRTKDMFCFFRMRDNDFNKLKDRRLNINPGYWSEKVRGSHNEGIREYVHERFLEEITKVYDENFKDRCGTEEKAEELWEKIDDQVLSCDQNGYAAHSAAYNFEHEGFEFTDFWETTITEYTFEYLWCCYAIVYAIEQYDLQKEKTNES